MLEHVRTDETRAVEERTGFLVAHTRIWQRPVLRVRGRHAFRCGETRGPERRFDTFVALGLPAADSVEALLGMEAKDVPETARPVLDAVSAVDAIADAEERTFHPCLDGEGGPRISLVAPRAGLIEHLTIDGTDLAQRIRRIAREREQDSEGRETPALCAMAMGLAADGPEDLDRIVDTVFSAAGTTRYRGVHSTLKEQDLVVARHQVGEVTVGEHGIDLKGLADTIRTAIHGRTLERQPLAALVEIPGFDGLLIRQVTRHGGADNLRVVVADPRMADLPRLDREAARTAAHRTLRARIGSPS